MRSGNSISGSGGDDENSLYDWYNDDIVIRLWLLIKPPERPNPLHRMAWRSKVNLTMVYLCIKNQTEMLGTFCCTENMVIKRGQTIWETNLDSFLI